MKGPVVDSDEYIVDSTDGETDARGLRSIVLPTQQSVAEPGIQSPLDDGKRFVTSGVDRSIYPPGIPVGTLAPGSAPARDPEPGADGAVTVSPPSPAGPTRSRDRIGGSTSGIDSTPDLAFSGELFLDWPT